MCENTYTRGEVEEIVEEAVDRAVEEAVEPLEERIEELEQQIAEQPDVEYRGDSKAIENLWINGVPIGNAIEKRKEETKELFEQIESIEQGTTNSEPEERVSDDYTPIERLAVLGDEVTDSKTAQRAATIFRHLSEWGTKTQRGLVLRSKEDSVRRLVNTARDENLEWKQIHRAYEVLEEMSDGYIEYHEDHPRHGKMIVMEEPMPSMQASSSTEALSESSAVA